ncbi:HTTM domain-containing protein [Halobaculum sp. MBLA0147]|uniref:HTTM domain-containing protein n=1 Tax=Halobaculum sp. MBLA0147 TaxID=3079934 RepID=UPI003523AA1D
MAPVSSSDPTPGRLRRLWRRLRYLSVHLSGRVRDRGRTWFATHAAVDTRALAALRIGVGLLLLVDLALRARWLRVFYTDAGVLPRETLRAVRPVVSSVSLHALWGSTTTQTGLFCLAGLAAMALLVGYRTRLACVVSLVLLVSLHARNPLVLNGGDSLLRRLLLWGSLLPLGTRWSIDAVRRAPPPTAASDGGGGAGVATTPRTVASVATLGLFVQVATVYVVNAAIKLRGSGWLDGTAVRYVFQLDRFTTPLGDLVAGTPAVVTTFGWAWLALLVVAPALVLASDWRRTAVAAGLLAGHLGMAATMWLGVFPVVAVVALLPALRSPVWNRVESAVAPVAARCRAATAWLVSRRGVGGIGSLAASTGRPNTGRWVAGGTRAVATLLLVGVLVWNAAALGVVPVETEAGAVEPERYRWDMFAPDPPRAAAWFAAPATTVDGRRVDAFPRPSAIGDRPPDVAATYPSVRWRKYLTAVWWHGGDRLRHATAAGLCERWNRRHDERLATVSLVVTREPTRLDRPERERLTTRRLVTHDCRTGDSAP